MSTFFLRWRFYWSRRSRTRILLAVAFFIVALLAIIYLALPTAEQTTVRDTLATAAQAIGALGPHTLLLIGIAACALVILFLILQPSYRHSTYLATSTSLIPPVSVYLDAENQLSERDIRAFMNFLTKYLDGRKTDLLYFLDASQTATGEKYKTLYRFGFRPVDVPHDPMGYVRVKEAVDKELAMHAYERALLGPPSQEFILVTGDGDFVALVYRLAALGHRVQVWAAPANPTYHKLASYLDLVTVNDFSHVVSELEIVSSEPSERPATLTPALTSKPKKAKARKQKKNQLSATVPPRLPVPTSLSRSGEAQLYYAIADTITARNDAQRGKSDQSKRDIFYNLLDTTFRPRLASVGYSAGSKWFDYWQEHLMMLGVLHRARGHALPTIGSASAEDAARSLYAIAEAAARAAVQVALTRPEEIVSMNGVATALAAHDFPSDTAAAPLLKLIAAGNDKRETHARYFVRSARALGLLTFDDVPDSLDKIAHPRLPETEAADESPEDAHPDETSAISTPAASAVAGDSSFIPSAELRGIGADVGPARQTDMVE
ncbi:MAG: hypothetical protein OJF49_002520 [Ktedonobacterales bacterium]|nr:MAG: hypothetical protein OJF49_002520 [Ktedonobacterales bacterium]